MATLVENLLSVAKHLRFGGNSPLKLLFVDAQHPVCLNFSYFAKNAVQRW